MSNTKKSIVAIVAVVALVSILAVCLCACNATAEDYKKKLEDKGYEVVDMTETVGNMSAAQIEFALVCRKGDEMVSIMKYKKSKDAKTAFDSSKMNAGDNWKKLVYRSGKVVIVATTEQGLKDAK